MIEWLAPISKFVKQLATDYTTARAAKIDNLDAAISAITPIRSIYYGSMTLGGTTSATAAIPAVTVAKTAVVMLGSSCNGTAAAAGANAVNTRITLTNTTTVTATRDTGTGSVTVSFVAIEYK
jgi:hypothetical protein